MLSRDTNGALGSMVVKSCHDTILNATHDNQRTSGNRVLPEKQEVPRLVTKFPEVYGNGRLISMITAVRPVNGDQCYFFRTSFVVIILPSMPVHSERSLSLGFPTKTCTFMYSPFCDIPHLSHFSCFDH